MRAYAKIKNRIHEKYSHLSKNNKAMSDFFLENFDRIPFLSVQDIAEATSKSVASVVRFSQTIGFKGFSDLRNEIAASFQSKLQNNNFFPLLDSEELKIDTLMSVANQDVKNINDTLNLIERDKFKKAIDLITNSKRVFTMGLGISYFLAEILAYQLNLVAIDSKTFNHSSASFFEQILFLDKKDIIIAFSFPPYSKDTIEAAKSAFAKGLKVIAITNKNSAPITFHSTYSLIVKSKNMLYTNSFAAISVLINAIATECAIKNKDKSQSMLKELDQFSKKYNNVTI
jgi:DNA-binding MurR/RpiR family transcriptional regulator